MSNMLFTYKKMSSANVFIDKAKKNHNFSIEQEGNKALHPSPESLFRCLKNQILALAAFYRPGGTVCVILDVRGHYGKYLCDFFLTWDSDPKDVIWVIVAFFVFWGFFCCLSIFFFQ